VGTTSTTGRVSDFALAAYRWLFALTFLDSLALLLGAGLLPPSLPATLGLGGRDWAAMRGYLLLTNLYGPAYALVASRPRRGTPLAAVGLALKVAGPAYWLAGVWRGTFSPRTFPLVLAADLVWWFPFLIYCVRGLPARRTIVAWVVVAVHVAACLALLASAGGTETEPDVAARARSVAGHVPLWVTTWTVWALASMSLLAFFVAWAARLLELGAARAAVVAGCLTCAAGVSFDLVGESVNLIGPVEPGQTVTEFARATRLYAVLSAGTANGLYCIGGLLLSALSWRVGFLRGRAGALGVVMWLVGLGLTATVVLREEWGMIATGAGVMALYIPWAAWVGWRLRGAPA
jgi:hypothetical protein